MYDLPKNTIMTFSANPLFDKMEIGNLPVSALADEIKQFQAAKGKNPAPETDALSFYFMNHAFHVLKSRFNAIEPLTPEISEVAQMHILATNEVAKRLFFYSTIICVEEARFLPTQDESFFDHIENNFGWEFKDYVAKGFPGALTDFGNLDMTCGQYATAMMSVFAFGKWQPGFGGRGWAPIASLVSDCVNGHLSLEGFADQAFSLCHNNGSMFNKGHLYSCYTQFIYEILDIQDSGQIPQWIANNRDSRFVSPSLKHAHDIMARHFPDEMTGKLDMSMIKNSAVKREQKAAAMAKKNAAAWNNLAQQQEAAKEARAKSDPRNKTLLTGLDIFDMKMKR